MIIFDFVLNFPAYIIWKAISDTVRMAYVSLLAQVFRLREFLVIISVHDDRTQGQWVKDESDRSWDSLQSHVWG